MFQSFVNDNIDPWNKSVYLIYEKLGTMVRPERKSQQRKVLFYHAVASVLAMKRDRSSLNTMAQPKHWIKLPVYVNDSQNIGALNR